MALIDALQIVCLTNPGQVRSHNEDSIDARPELGIVVIADGMGGYNAGEVASSMATSSIVAGLVKYWTPDALKKLDRDAAKMLSQSVLQEQVKNANAAIFTAAQNDPNCAEMGTTVVACLFYDDFLTVGHVGDSRLYRLRNDVLEQLTRDHSLLQEQIDSGMISQEDAHLSSNKNFLTRAVGINPDEQAEIHSHDVLEDDIFLLCTDGLYGMVDQEDIALTLNTLKANPGLAAEQLIEAANDAGGHDNVSVVFVRTLKSFAVDRSAALS